MMTTCENANAVQFRYDNSHGLIMYNVKWLCQVIGVTYGQIFCF